MNKLITLFCSLFLFLSLTVLLLGYYLPYGQKNQSHLFVVRNGDGLSRIAYNLEKAGLVRSGKAFKAYAILLGKNRSFKKGEFPIRGKVSIADLVSLLDRGNEQLLKVTIREGLRMTEIYEILRKNGYKNEGNYHRFSYDKHFIQSLGLPKQVTSLEGFLFPDTYLFSENATEKKILSVMVNTFLDRLPENYGELAKNAGLDFYDAVNLAAIIEKETGAPDERKLISSVFHNRLKKDMRLQTDPTVIYGIKNFDGNLTRKQLRTKTAYNTYKIKGLPPTPIASPGLEALIAAVQPLNTKYLYFVAMGNGRHKFTTNYRDHRKAVIRYQKRRVKNYRSH